LVQRRNQTSVQKTQRKGILTIQRKKKNLSEETGEGSVHSRVERKKTNKGR